jgi:hypothetical protein
MNANKLLMFYGMLDPQNNCQPLYTRAQLTATTTFVGGGSSVTADVTSLVAWSLNSANTSVAVVDTTSASVIGRSFGSTVVSFLGSTSSGITVTVSNDTLAFAIGVDVATVAQLNVGLPSSQFAPLSSQIVNATAVQGNITQVGSSQSLVATGVVFDPVRNVQYRHPLSPQSGLNVTPLNTSIATASTVLKDSAVYLQPEATWQEWCIDTAASLMLFHKHFSQPASEKKQEQKEDNEVRLGQAQSPEEEKAFVADDPGEVSSFGGTNEKAHQN